MIELREVLSALVAGEARFVVIGGVALRLHGSAYVTVDLDLAYERTRDNARRMASALGRFAPRPRGFPPDVPFVFDAQTLMSNEVLTLATTAGEIDLLAFVKGVGAFPQVDAAAETIEFDGFALRVLSVDGLIAAKTAAGRAKDRPGLVELEAIKELRRLERGG